MDYKRMPIEVESPEELGYDSIECNLAESSVRDQKFSFFKDSDLSELILCYGCHRGHSDLRSAIANEAGVESDDVLLVPGAAAGLFIISTSLLKKDTELIVAHPNYATNLETPLAIGAHIKRLELKFEDKFKVDLKRLNSMMSADTGLVSITTPHNPTGTMMRGEEVEQVIDMVCRTKNKFLLIDETYRYMTFEEPAGVGAGVHENVISVSSVSKAFGLPGIRVGWIICRNKKLMEMFLAAKEQILICNSVIDEELAWKAFSRRDEILEEIKKRVTVNFNVVENWIDAHEDLEWVRPSGGVVCFPRFRNSAIDTDKFYSVLFEKYKTLVGPGHWFDMPDTYMRIGFGWPSEEELRSGLERIDRAIRELR